MGDRSLARHTLEYTSTETTKICSHITNGVRTLDLDVRAAEDRMFVHMVEQPQLSAYTSRRGVEVYLHSFLTSVVDRLHGANEEKKLLQRGIDTQSSIWRPV